MVEYDGIEFPDEEPREIKVEFKDPKNEEFFKKLYQDMDELFGRGNGNGDDKRSKEKAKKKIAIKKYSQNGNGPLFESVVIAQRPTFVYLDKNNKPQFLDEIPRINDILIPDDTIDTKNPIPFVFDSKEDLEKCLEEASKETPDSLFIKVDKEFRKYVNAEEHYYPLLVGDTIWTWFQDRFGYTHYNIIVGDNGSGKNSALLVFKYLGYRVFYTVSASAANYYTKMGNVEEGQITIAEDEAEDIAEDREKRNVWKTGYCSGASVPKVELEGGRKSEDWLTYGQKWATMEELPEIKQMKGVLDRSFVLKFVIGDVPYNIKDVIRDAGEPEFKPLHDKLMHLRKVLFCYRLLHYDEPIFDVNLNVKNRTQELTKSLIRLFQNSPIALAKILEALTKFMVERNEIKNDSFERRLYEVIDILRKERKQRLEDGTLTAEDSALDESTFTNLSIKEKCKELLNAEEIIDKNGVPALYSADVGAFTQTKITRVLKSKFKARPEPKPIRIGDKTHRCIKLEQKYLERIKSGYDIPDKIEIIAKDKKEKDKDKQARENVTDVTHVTLPGGILPLYSDIVSAKIAAISQDLIENHLKNEENYTNQAASDGQKEALVPPRSVTSVTSVTNEEKEESKK